jgi:hypothetical protein
MSRFYDRLSPAEQDQLNVLWHQELARPVHAIAAEFGLSGDALVHVARRDGWLCRRGARRRLMPKCRSHQKKPISSPELSPAGPAVDPVRAAAAVARQCARQLAALDAGIASGEIDADRAARTLALLARTLKTAQSLTAQGGAASDDDPDERACRDIPTLRDELLAHLSGAAAERGDADRTGGADEQRIAAPV